MVAKTVVITNGQAIAALQPTVLTCGRVCLFFIFSIVSAIAITNISKLKIADLQAC